MAGSREYRSFRSPQHLKTSRIICRSGGCPNPDAAAVGAKLVLVAQACLFFGRVRKPFNNILSPCHTHDRDTRHFADSPLEISIVRCDNIDLVSHDSIDNTVVGVCSGVTALQTLPSFISCDPKCDPVFLSQLFQFGHNLQNSVISTEDRNQNAQNRGIDILAWQGLACDPCGIVT